MRILILLLLLPFVSQAKDLKIVMFNVFHGDLIYIDLPNGKNMLVDTGKKGKPKKFLFPFLHSKNIKKIDYLVLTHMDYDHIGGAKEVIDKYDIGVIFYNGQDRGNKPQLRYLQAAKEKNIPIIILNSDPDLSNIVSLDNNLKMHVYHPMIKSESNNLSLVFKLVYKDFSMLFSGDLEKEGQKKVHDLYGNDLKSDVYKVAHHGDSSYTPFIDAISPKISLCPCLKIPLVMPNRKTVRLLKKYGDFYSVRNSGTLVLATDGKNITIEPLK